MFHMSTPAYVPLRELLLVGETLHMRLSRCICHNPVLALEPRG